MDFAVLVDKPTAKMQLKQTALELLQKDLSGTALQLGVRLWVQNRLQP